MQNSSLSIPIPTNEFLELVDFLRENDSPLDPVFAIRLAIDYWIESSETWVEEDWRRILHVGELEEPERPKSSGPKSPGYLWKTVLLPSGTQVRMQYKGETHHADIKGDAFVYNNNVTSPSNFANTVAGGTSRNAWRDLWVKRPTDQKFHPASALRRGRSQNSETL